MRGLVLVLALIFPMQGGTLLEELAECERSRLDDANLFQARISVLENEIRDMQVQHRLEKERLRDQCEAERLHRQVETYLLNRRLGNALLENFRLRSQVMRLETLLRICEGGS